LKWSFETDYVNDQSVAADHQGACRKRHRAGSRHQAMEEAVLTASRKFYKGDEG
jgi:hypothetical protein